MKNNGLSITAFAAATGAVYRVRQRMGVSKVAPKYRPMMGDWKPSILSAPGPVLPCESETYNNGGNRVYGSSV